MREKYIIQMKVKIEVKMIMSRQFLKKINVMCHVDDYKDPVHFLQSTNSQINGKSIEH